MRLESKLINRSLRKRDSAKLLAFRCRSLGFYPDRLGVVRKDSILT